MLGWVGKFGRVSGVLGWRLCGPVLGGIIDISGGGGGQTKAVVVVD